MESQRIIGYTSSSGNSGSYMSQQYGLGTLFGPDANALNFQAAVWAKTGNITPYGNGGFGDGPVCVFTGNAIKINAG